MNCFVNTDNNPIKNITHFYKIIFKIIELYFFPIIFQVENKSDFLLLYYNKKYDI